MPTFKGKDGKMSFSMNPQVGKAMHGDMPPGLDSVMGDQTPADDSHVELHHGGHPQGDPPPTETTKYHTISTKSDGSQPEIKNHEDYSGADQHMQECMGESDGGNQDMNFDEGGDSGEE